MKVPKFTNEPIEGEEKYITCLKGTRKFTKAYTIWQLIRVRSYSEKFHLKNPSYVGCSVSPEWHNFQNFAKWFEENYIEGYQLDKDILIKGNKIYSPDTCCFVPHEINTQIQTRLKKSVYGLGVSKERNKDTFYIKILVDGERKYFGFKSLTMAQNAYRMYKENLVKNLVGRFKYSLDERVYIKLINYKIEDYD